jgi:endonuclease/exonuclease/phosphatase family metal-dependent hydrolase
MQTPRDRSPLPFLAALLAALVLLHGCSSSPGADASRVVVGTFNIEWLGDGVEDRMPRTDQQYLAIADIVIKSGADVLAVQEVENQAALAKITRYLSGYQGALSTSGGDQRVGVLYRAGTTVRVLGDYTPLQLDAPNRLRPGLLLECRKGAFQWLQLCVHLKSTSRYDSTPALADESRVLRRRQVEVLKKFMDSVIAAGEETEVMITGDFNDYPARRSNATLEPLEDGSVVFLTRELSSCANAKWHVIDHVVASPQAALRYISGSERVENHTAYLDKETSEAVSDHCPVVVAFRCSP